MSANDDDFFRGYLRNFFGVQDEGEGVKVNVYAGDQHFKFIFAGTVSEFVDGMARRGAGVAEIWRLESCFDRNPSCAGYA